LITADPVEASVNVTHNGAQPETALAVMVGTGGGSTVTVTVEVMLGEHPSFTVTVYVVVEAGVAVGFPIAGLFRPVAGSQE
jgi:hypothetical protein